jgi:hypothetical protein
MLNAFAGAIIGAALGTVSGGGEDDASRRPVRLETQQTGEGLLVRVIGQSSVDVSLRYRLKLSGGSRGGNRVDQGGAAALEAGEHPRTLATIRMTGSDPRGRLLVQIDGGGEYEELIGSTE